MLSALLYSSTSCSFFWLYIPVRKLRFSIQPINHVLFLFLNLPGYTTFKYCYLCAFVQSFYSSELYGSMLFLLDGSEVVSTLPSIPAPLPLVVSKCCTVIGETRSVTSVKVRRVANGYKGSFD